MEENKNIEIVRDGSRLMSYESYQKIRRNQRIAVVLTVVLVAASLFIAFWNRTFNSYEELTWTQNTEGNGTQYAVYLDGYLKYSKDGISYMNQKESLIWTEAYTMDKPVIAVSEQYAAVADMEGNAVYLYDKSGKVGGYSMSYPVKKIMVAEQGVFCVVLDGDDVNYIRLYDKDGEMLAEIKTQIEINGYPMSVALSPDGSRLVASYYRVDGIDSQNILSFYNFGEGGKGQSGPLIGTYQFDNMLIPKIVFTGDDTVYVVGDSKMLVYNVESKPKQLKEIVYPADIINVFSNEKYVGFTCENPVESVEAEEASPYEIYIYNKNGRLKKHFGVEKVYETVQIIDNVIVGYTGTVCSMVRTNGTEAFSYDMGRNISSVLPTSSRTEFLVVYSEGSARIRLKNDLAVQLTEEVEEVSLDDAEEINDDALDDVDDSGDIDLDDAGNSDSDIMDDTDDIDNAENGDNE